MQFIEGENRNQSILFPQSLDQLISTENEVRVIDLFVESIKLEDFHFAIKVTKEGRPAYHPKDVLKIFVYGYLNHIRSSRQLEKECKRNIELMWLTKQLTPDHNTISNFRRDNEKAIKKVFRYTVSIARQFDLIGGKLIAGDSTKLRAQNSKKNNFNADKIERHIAYIDARLEEYNKALAIADNDHKESIAADIKKHQDRRDDYENMQQQLEQSGEAQISTTDPESRQLSTRNNITEVAYNVQTTVDAKHNLPIDYKVTNQNDTRALSGMLRRTKTILGTNDFTALYDKGYHTGGEIKAAVTAGIDIMVAIPGVSSFAPDASYNMERFIYDELSDTYQCPQGQILITTGVQYQKNSRTNSYAVKHYKTTACKSCPVKHLCTKSSRVRLIERSEFTPYIEQNKQNITDRPEIYKRRQSIVEHPYGTIKRQWGFYYIITKRGLKRASADVGFMFIAYNLRRLMNIIDRNTFQQFLRELTKFFKRQMPSLKAFIFKIIAPILSINQITYNFLAAQIVPKKLFLSTHGSS
jgi:transposase